MKLLVGAVALFAVSNIAQAAEPVVAISPEAQRQLLDSSDPQLAANKKLVWDMWRNFLQARRIEEADKYLAPEYHQHNPNADHWGDMSWGHAVSTDLISWDERPVAIRPDVDAEGRPLEHVFSGSAVVDGDDLVAIYTSVALPSTASASGRPGLQTQHLARSTDGGETWVKDPSNPVLDRGLYRAYWEATYTDGSTARTEGEFVIDVSSLSVTHTTVPVIPDFRSDTSFDPRGTDASLGATWTINGSVPDAAACSAAGMAAGSMCASTSTATPTSSRSIRSPACIRNIRTCRSWPRRSGWTTCRSSAES